MIPLMSAFTCSSERTQITQNATASGTCGLTIQTVAHPQPHAGRRAPAISSVREHRGHLYIGGVTHNRIGRIKLAGADPDWTVQASYSDARA